MRSSPEAKPPETISPGFFWRPHWSKPPALLLLELFVAVALTVNFFYLVRPQCVPKSDGNAYSATTFAYISATASLSPEDTLPSWRGRLLAPMVSGWFLDKFRQDPADSKAPKISTSTDLFELGWFQNLFGLYHALWLFLTFLVIIIFRRDALLIILGAFAGLMYNLTVPAGMYYYPWDMPALLFFTLACLLFDKGWIGALLPVIVLGALFKETVLCCSLLVLLGTHWNAWKRIAGFLAVVVATLGLNHLLILHYHMNSGMFPMSGTPPGLSHTSLLFQNISFLFSLSLNHVLFSNAGVLFLMMLLPWQSRRDLIFKLIIVVFAAGQFIFGVIGEVRIWYELLPLGWILVSEALSRPQSTLNGDPAGPAGRRERLLRGSYWLSLGVLAVVLSGTWVTAKLCMPPLDPRSSEQLLQDLIAQANTGNPLAQYKLAMAYEDRQNYTAAVPWLQKAAEQGLLDAQYNLGLVFYNILHDPTAATPWFAKAASREHPASLYYLGLINWNQEKFTEAFPLFQRSAEKGDMYGEWMLGTIYLKTKNGDLVEAYKWLKLAQLQGFNTATTDFNKCVERMTADQIAQAEKKVKEFQESHPPATAEP